MRPPGRTDARACAIDVSVPTHSRTQSAPTSPSRSRRTAAPSSPRAAITSAAPNRVAMTCLGVCDEKAITRSAPSRRAASTPHRPTAPSPTTATVLPGPTPAETAAW